MASAFSVAAGAAAAAMLLHRRRRPSEDTLNSVSDSLYRDESSRSVDAAWRNKVELHRHLEGSIPVETLWRMQNEGLLDTEFPTKDALQKTCVLVKPMKTLEELLEAFDVFQRAFAYKWSGDAKKAAKATYDITMDVIRGLEGEGIGHCELRFSPHFMDGRTDLSELPAGRTHPEIWDVMMRAMLRARADALTEIQEARGADDTRPPMRVGFIAIVSRENGPSSGVATARFCEAWRKDIIGFDFASTELMHGIDDFAETIEIVHAMKLPLTVHCGEAAGEASVKRIVDTLEKYAPVLRVGHATAMIEDESVTQRAIRDGVMVECCPTSNIITGCFKAYEDGHLPILYKAGVKVSVSTDDPGLWGVGLDEEWQRCVERVGMSREELAEINEMARAATFPGSTDAKEARAAAEARGAD